MTTRAASRKNPTRIQQEKTEAILSGALDIFSKQGFRGATLDEIAEAAHISKPNLLYYFSSKEDVHQALLAKLLATWLDPLQQLDPAGDPRAEILNYVRRKLDMARKYPRESRLFAGEIIRGAAHIEATLRGPLREMVSEKVEVIRMWMDQGKIARLDPYHLIFTIWASTQHYADFDVQVRAVLGRDDDSHFAGAEAFLITLFGQALAPK